MSTFSSCPPRQKKKTEAHLRRQGFFPCVLKKDMLAFYSERVADHSRNESEDTMRTVSWGGKTYINISDQRLWARVHLALCKNVLGSKTGHVYESERDGQPSVSVVGVEVARDQTSGETLYNMRSGGLIDTLVGLTPEQIKEKHPVMYNSMIYHFMSVRRALCAYDKDISADYPDDYPHHEDLSPYWAEEVVPFLSEMTDQEIADICGCAPQRIADIRLIVCFTQQKRLTLSLSFRCHGPLISVAFFFCGLPSIWSGVRIQAMLFAKESV